MRELDMASIAFSKTDWLLLQSLLVRQTLLLDKLNSVVRPQLIDIPLLGTSARACQMRASGDGCYLSPCYRRRGILIHLSSGLICGGFRS